MTDLQTKLHKILDDIQEQYGITISPYWYQEVNVALYKRQAEMKGAKAILEAISRLEGLESGAWQKIRTIDVAATVAKITD